MGLTGLGIDITPGGLMAMIFFSLVGFVYYKRGKSNGPRSHMVYGIALMVYPYFITNTVGVVLVGLVIMVLSYFVPFG